VQRKLQALALPNSLGQDTSFPRAHSIVLGTVVINNNKGFPSLLMSCRYLGVWGTPTGDMSDTKGRIFPKTEEARDLVRHHPLTPEQAIDLFMSIGVGAFRYSAALVPWTERELERLEAMWVGASIHVGMGLTWTTASDVFTLPSVVAGMEYPRPIGIMAQELCRHLQRCLKHEDVARQLTLRDINLACEQWAWSSLKKMPMRIKSSEGRVGQAQRAS
jgi:hypothetical protein